MIKRSDLRTATILLTLAGGDVAVGSNIPLNMFRFIYKIKAINEFAGGPNLITLGRRENGAVATTVIDYVRFATQYETWVDPDELKEDSAPLYVVGGQGAVGASTFRAFVSAGNAYLTISYIDAPD